MWAAIGGRRRCARVLRPGHPLRPALERNNLACAYQASGIRFSGLPVQPDLRRGRPGTAGGVLTVGEHPVSGGLQRQHRPMAVNGSLPIQTRHPAGSLISRYRYGRMQERYMLHLASCMVRGDDGTDLIGAVQWMLREPTAHRASQNSLRLPAR